jgi:catechol 2,3-dioxygenase-like lactoylglutathione lyase family enzyme
MSRIDHVGIATESIEDASVFWELIGLRPGRDEVNLEQDVIKLADEKFGNGVMPDIKIVQNHTDFLNNKDTQLNFAFELIKKKKQK